MVLPPLHDRFPFSPSKEAKERIWNMVKVRMVLTSDMQPVLTGEAKERMWRLVLSRISAHVRGAVPSLEELLAPPAEVLVTLMLA